MKATISCRHCGHVQTIVDEPTALAALACPSCQRVAEARASEDFATAIEDAVAQLGILAETFDIDLSVSTRRIPPAFRADDEGPSSA